MPGDPTASSRRAALDDLRDRVRECPRCAQPATGRSTVVVGAGPADATLMLVGRAPGTSEERQGLPLVGEPARLLDELLDGVGLRRADVYVTTVLKHRPPDHRDPTPDELDHGLEHLREQVEIVAPRVLCPLGELVTKLLRRDPEGIRTAHGRPEVCRVGDATVRLLPLFDPAAALYRRSAVDALRADVARLPELLALPAPRPIAGADRATDPAPEDAGPGAGGDGRRGGDGPRADRADGDGPDDAGPVQLDLF
ncbi:MAG: uracil-DNA glycosylase [Solirubrobacteraceae bacterium]|nr:uracil-DNA glycosylase [Solirubrobacteraceae bacterium]